MVTRTNRWIADMGIPGPLQIVVAGTQGSGSVISDQSSRISDCQQEPYPRGTLFRPCAGIIFAAGIGRGYM